jgi:hypothetical protein
VAIGVIAIGAAVPGLSGAAAPPALPALGAQQVLAEVFSSKPPELSGALTWDANLGLSGLSTLEQDVGSGSSSSAASGLSGGAAQGGFDPLALLSGSYTIDVWLGGPAAEHLALIEGTASEVDLVREGNQAWLWDSSNSSVLHLLGLPTGTASAGGPVTSTTAAPLTPDQLAQRLLGRSAATTDITLGEPLYVAGQAAYQLLAAPKAGSGSTVERVEVDVAADGALAGTVLQVAVYATGQASPALQLGFTGSVNVGPPPAGELTFSVPPGATVTTRNVGSGGELSGQRPPLSSPGGEGQVSAEGQGWGAVLSGTSTAAVQSLQQDGMAALMTRVTVGGQQAWLLSTSLLNVLLLPDGAYYAGLVTPKTLEDDAAAGVAASGTGAAGS